MKLTVIADVLIVSFKEL
ncbi:hypothetical protein [Massilia sp. BJB1822]